MIPRQSVYLETILEYWFISITQINFKVNFRKFKNKDDNIRLT